MSRTSSPKILDNFFDQCREQGIAGIGHETISALGHAALEMTGKAPHEEEYRRPHRNGCPAVTKPNPCAARLALGTPTQMRHCGENYTSAGACLWA